MALTAQQRIRLQELLLQREALYARVHTCETKIHRLFGAEYPLPPPPVEIAPHRSRSVQAKKAPHPDRPPKISPLKGDETAYRVRFHEETGADDEIHTDRKVIEAMLQSPVAATLIAAVETLGPDDEVREQVFP